MKTQFHLPTHRVLLAAGSVALAAFSGCSRHEPEFNASRITEDVRIFASDDFAGRAPATEGEQKTVAHLVSRLQTMNIAPGGDLLPDGKRAWTQDVPLVRAVIAGPVDVQLHAGGNAIAFTQGEQVALRATQTGATEVAIDQVPLVFVGYGVTAPERQWDDFKGLDLKGKIALVLVNDPDFETGEGDFGGKAMTYYGRWTYKFQEAARRGAVGALVIHETDPAAYGWATVRNSNTIEMFDVRRADPLSEHPPVEGWIQRDVTVDLFKRAGLDFEQQKALARTREFQPVVLKDVSLSATYKVDVSEVVAKNVVGVLTGTTHPDEWVIYTSHHDHMGAGEADANGDSIFNGAVDNAAGTAQVLEIARNFAKAKRTERSIAFLFVGAEEKGLLGSEYYAANPLYPLAKTVANLNSDAPRPTGPAKDFTTSGDAPVTLQDILIEEGKKFDRHYSPDARPEAGFFFRSDHFSFARRGVPAISFKTGEDLVEGGREAGKAWGEAYTRDRYHQPADNFDAAEWRSDGIADDAALLYSLGLRLANSREWPEWKEGSEFKALRDASAAERKE